MASQRNPIRLFDCSLGSSMCDFNVTNSERFRGVVDMISRIRRRLVSNRTFREPYLDLLKGLYSKQYQAVDIRSVQPFPPSDRSILFFFTDRWPDVRLLPQGPDDGCEWGSTCTGIQAVDDNAIHINYPFVYHWLKMNRRRKRTPSQSVTTDQLCVQFLAILLNELGYKMLVWWSRGLCSTPKHAPIFAEASRFIAREFFGGVTDGVWVSGKEGHGNFRYLRGFVLDVEDGRVLSLDGNAASLILRNFRTFRARLPLVDVTSLQIAKHKGLRRTKVALIDGCKDDDDSETTGASQTLYPVEELVGFGLVMRVGIVNDKMHID